MGLRHQPPRQGADRNSRYAPSAHARNSRSLDGSYTPAFRLNALVLAGSCALAGLGGALALAPQAVQAAEPAATARDYAIPAGRLSDALAEFAAASGVALSFAPQALQGQQSSGLQGRYTVQQGFARLLDGTDWQVQAQGGNAYTLRQGVQAQPEAAAPGPGSSRGGVGVLPEVVVTAVSDGSSHLPPAYAGGQVASGSRVGLLGNKDFMETPFSTISYTEEYVRNRQATDIGEVIAATDPTIYLPQKRNYIDSFYIRGFNTNAIDTTFNGLAGMAPFLRGSSEIAERVEVLKGPSAMLNGMLPGGSVGGSVNIVPKRAADKPLTRLTTTYESDGLLGGHVDVGRRFGQAQQWGVRVNGLYRDGDTAVDDQQQRTELAALALDWRDTAARLSLDLYRQKSRTDGLNYFGIASISPLVTELPAPRKGDALIVPPGVLARMKPLRVFYAAKWIWMC